jgi:hypothetical protein
MGNLLLDSIRPTMLISDLGSEPETVTSSTKRV